MSYIITEKHHSLTISLKTTYQYKSNLKLGVYVNDSTSVHSPIYSATSTTDGVVFNIPYSDFSIGNEITAIRVYTNSTTDLWDTREGVNILLNGDDYSVSKAENNAVVIDPVTDGEIKEMPCRSEQFAIKFTDVGDYSLQGFYVGNDFVEYATTDEFNFKVSEQSVSPTPTEDVIKLEFENPNLSNMVWNDKTRIAYVLTKNGQPMASETVECLFGRSIWSEVTNSKGVASNTNHSIDAGTYQFGAYYVDDGHIVAKTVYKTLTVKKANANITYTNSTISRNGTLNIWIKDQYGSPITSENVSVYVNGKLKSKKTDSTGKISFKLTAKGTYKFKVVYKGNKNINSKTVSFNKTVN